MKITSYVFFIKDPHIKKNQHYFQHKTGIAPGPPLSQQNKKVSIEAPRTQDRFCNTAKNTM